MSGNRLPDRMVQSASQSNVRAARMRPQVRSAEARFFEKALAKSGKW